MNTERFHGQWRAVKGWARESWGRVTNDPWQRIAGRRERLLGELEASLATSRRIAEASFPVRHAPARASHDRRASR